MKRALCALVLLLPLWAGGAAAAAPKQPPPPPSTCPGVQYTHERVRAKPWSIHVLRIDLRKRFRYHAALGKGKVYGLSQLRTMIRSAPRGFGRCVAGVNADFYHIRRGPYQGDPIGLHILEGELVSLPSSLSFWFDKGGRPHIAEVRSKMTAQLPGGQAEAIGLNQARADASAVLYTPRFGPSTHTAGGTELVLSPTDRTNWLPLRAGRAYFARIAEVRGAGDTKIPPGGLVLSLGPKRKLPELKAGARVIVRTALSGDFSAVTTALGGGPMLVDKGKIVAKDLTGPRHPRTAIGFSETHLVLALVDGRQKGLSIGMRLHELADVMKQHGCTTAMNLDGGGSSTMWHVGRVVNSPSDGRQRALSNALLVFAPWLPAAPPRR